MLSFKTSYEQLKEQFDEAERGRQNVLEESTILKQSAIDEEKQMNERH